jgi:transcription elongation factor Elf1
MTTDDETSNHLGPECPHCGKVTQADDPFFYTDDRENLTCGWCEEDFAFTYHRTDSWTARKLPK